MKNSAFLLIFGLFWTTMVGFFDCMIGSGLYHQIRTGSYATTTGQIVSSQVTVHRGKHTSYTADIHYRYNVALPSAEGGTRSSAGPAAGPSYESSNYRYGSFQPSDSTSANAVVRAHPAGSAVTVHYDPRQPDEAVLSTGLEGGDLFIPLFLVPFNLVALGLLSVPLGALSRKLHRPEAGGVKFRLDGMRLRVSLPRYPPLLAGAAAIGVAAFASIFLVGISTSAQPSMPLILAVWLVILGLGGGAAGWTAARQAGGRSDLVIDPEAQVVELPQIFGRKQPESIPLAAVQAVQVETIEHRGSKGGRYYTYPVSLQRSDGPGVKLTDWSDESRARALAAWLREKLALPAADADAPG